MGQKLVDVYEVKETAYTIATAPVTDAGGFHILGKLVGPHFVPDGTSRNQRYYPRSLWEKVLSDPKTHQKLDRKLMVGTIGHADNFDVEKFAREGLLSHITTKIWIDENTGLGMAEDWILDTPAGRNLFAMCKAGCRFYTSSRAAGSFKNEKYRGMPVVDEKTYDLGGWDMVVDPGFLEADPSLVESLKRNGITSDVQSSIDNPTNGGNSMSAELMEKLTREKMAVEKGLNEALTELNVYKKIGPANRIIEALKRLHGYKDLGSAADIAKAFDLAESALKEYKELGSPADIRKGLALAEKMLNKYKLLGTPDEINEALDRATEIFEKYKVLGTPAEIDEALDKAFGLAESTRKARNESAAKRLAKAYKAPLSVVMTMMGEMKNARTVESCLKRLREEQDSGYNLGIDPEAPGVDADDTLMKHFDDEGEDILGDVVGPDGEIDLDKSGSPDEDERQAGMGDDEFGDMKSGEDTDEYSNESRKRRMSESKGKGGFRQMSVFEQLVRTK